MNMQKSGKNLKKLNYQMPDCDIYESGSEYIIYFDIPGVEKQDIDLLIENDMLSMTAGSSKQAGDDYSCIRTEMSYSGYHRRFNLNNKVDPDNIKAVYNNGTLKLVLTKKESQPSKTIPITVH